MWVHSIRLPTFKTVFGDHKIFKVCRISGDEVSKSEVAISKSNFLCVKSFVNESNNVFKGKEIIFATKGVYIIIKKTSESDSVILFTSNSMMEMLGCDSKNIPKTDNLYWIKKPKDILFCVT